MSIDLARLAEPFPADDIEWRLQQCGEKAGRVWAMCLAYVTNRAIMQRLDDVCGPANWRNEFVTGPGGGILCGISIYLPNGVDGLHWVTKFDGAENTDVEAVKGGLSGAMKRAAVQWGIGRYLYNLDETFAEVSESGKYRGRTKDGTSFKWSPKPLPAWALPHATYAKPAGLPKMLSTEEHDELIAVLEERVGRMPEGVTGTVDGLEVPDLKTFATERWNDVVSDCFFALALRDALDAAAKSRKPRRAA